ncbi:bifunctional diguanylate cyclase/phosphodiesterase [Aquabacterium sp.]|uniref:bifunctional diguanylate cyclase/phosphodiesterase n=1 Tax=Aquabacterium sp. TaxID=1872578 RepID=UPI002CFF3412|nr:EAL domain-containing protein [Aquabacterium sp.]HSW06913.1 EAL domain-containing protein [Aquabacterium sp.]
MPSKSIVVRSKFILPLVVLVLGAALSIALGLAAHQEIGQAAQQRFDAVSRDVAHKVEGRFDNYVEVLAGLRARFNTAAPLTRDEFKAYVDGLRLARNFPGFQVVNYAPHVKAADKQRFEAQMRSDAGLSAATAAGFAIKPPGERADYYPLAFIEPMSGKEIFLGTDLGAMPDRGRALELARDADGLVSSGRKIRVPGRESDLGLAIRLPVYRPNLPLDTVAQRREAYLGSVGAGFSIAGMMRDVVGSDAAAAPLRFRLLDGGPSLETIGTRVESAFVAPSAVAEGQLLYDNAAVAGSAARVETAESPPRFERTLAFKLGGHAWRVEVSQDKRHVVGGLDMAIPWLIAFGGLAISTLLAGISYSLTTARGRAQALAIVMTSQLRKGAMRLKLEHEIARLLVGDGAAAGVIGRALATVCAHLHWDCAALWSLDDDGRVRCSAAWHVGDDADIARFVRVSRSLDYRADEGSLGRAWALGDAVRIAPLTAGPDFTRDALAGRAGLTVGLIVPMSRATARRTTALEFFSREPHPADADALESLRVIALQIAQYEQRKRAERDLLYMANHDALTGLPNRAALQRDLNRAVQRNTRHRKRFAVMFIDLDRFKHINDTLGHGAGDAMIKACSERLVGLLRGEDVVARFGGDEFVLLLEDLANAGDAAALADKVLACCAEPFVVDGRELQLTASIGVSLFPEDGRDAETLLKNADTAMYRAKDKGCGTYGFYTAQMNAQGSERLALESGLRHALERGELDLHYQPRMNLQTQVIVGVEALMRWHHPVLGKVPPVQFIPIAEEIGLIEAFGKWALQKACIDARTWQDCGLPAVQMSVNLSPRQLNSRTLIADIRSTLETTGLAPSLLELEITEGAMMKNPEQAVALLQEIRDMGVGLAIDDFGTGYSSLSYLKRFPLSTVKIDRSFVNDLPLDADAQALTNGIITLAHGLRMKVVAEGVESAAQLAYLRSRGCDEIQGYWLCRPLPADEVCQFMARHMRAVFASPVAA